MTAAAMGRKSSGSAGRARDLYARRDQGRRKEDAGQRVEIPPGLGHAAGRTDPAALEDVARLPERREGLRRPARRARRLSVSVEHTKRYTTLGMATDQGKLSNINGLAVLADSFGSRDPAGRHHHLPPALHARHHRRAGGRMRGARSSSPSAAPRCTKRMRNQAPTSNPSASGAAPTASRALARRTNRPSTARSLNTRANLGLLDASTLGKIIVKGPDAGKFLDMLYTGVMSHAARRQVPLRPDVQRTGLPVR